jgi:hypothetical protein
MQFIRDRFCVNQIDQAVAGQPDDGVAGLFICGVGYVFKFDGEGVAEDINDPRKLYVMLALDLGRFIFVLGKFHPAIIHTYAYSL